ncbi:MAG: site-2 protease family protein [bacterium]
MNLIIFFAVLAILVLSHEFGHFIVAKLSGIRVDEFGFGFPPKLFSFKWGETEYSFNLIPFGGFVKIFGEENNDEFLKASEEVRNRSLSAKSKKIQAAVMLAGVSFNFILAWFLISSTITIGAPVSVSELPERLKAEETHLAIMNVLSSSPAKKAGLEAGDEIIFLSTATSTIQAESITVENVQGFIASNSDQNIFVGYKRNGMASTTNVIPVAGIANGKPAIGVSLDMVGTLKLPFYQAIPEGLILSVKITYSMCLGLVDFIYGFFTGQSSVSNVSGPVGMVGLVGKASEDGLVQLMNMIALISINLAVLNLVPFPVLDGGRLFLLFAEYLRGKPLNPEVVNKMSVVCFALLLFVMAAVTLSDVVKIIFPA